jgi:hypothetical protein
MEETMDHGQIIPFRSKTHHQGIPRSWRCPITEQLVVDGIHARGARCWSTSGHPLQVMPAAEGWRAVYRYEDRVVTLQVVCWVLTEYCDSTRDVVGWVLDGKSVDRADSDSYVGFDGYLEPGSAAPPLDMRPPQSIAQDGEAGRSDEPVFATQ